MTSSMTFLGSEEWFLCGDIIFSKGHYIYRQFPVNIIDSITNESLDIYRIHINTYESWNDIESIAMNNGKNKDRHIMDMISSINYIIVDMKNMDSSFRKIKSMKEKQTQWFLNIVNNIR